MKNYRYIRMSLRFVNLASFLIAFAFLLPAQNVSKVYGQENPRCKSNKNYIKNYKRQVGDLRIVQDLVYRKRDPIVVQQRYADLRSAVANRELLDIYRSDRARIDSARTYNLEWQGRFPWETDQPGFQVALRNKIGQLLDKAKNYTSRTSIDRDIENLQKSINKHETNLVALGCDKRTEKGNQSANCWNGVFRGSDIVARYTLDIHLTRLTDRKRWKMQFFPHNGSKPAPWILFGSEEGNSLTLRQNATGPSDKIVFTWLPGKTCNAFEGVRAGTKYWQMDRQ